MQKKARDRLMRLAAKHPEWLLAYADEVWWSQLAQPALHSWSEGKPLQLEELVAEKNDTDPKALSCYVLLRSDAEKIWLRFVQGRSVFGITTQFLAWVCE